MADKHQTLEEQHSADLLARILKAEAAATGSTRKKIDAAYADQKKAEKKAGR